MKKRYPMSEKRWREANKARCKDYCREYRRANRETILARERLYRKTNQAHSAQYARDRRAAGQRLVEAIKDVPCADCGVRYPPYVMDFDHVRGTKISNLSNLFAADFDVIMEEALKCDIVCANCHRERTFNPRVSAVA